MHVRMYACFVYFVGASCVLRACFVRALKVCTPLHYQIFAVGGGSIGTSSTSPLADRALALAFAGGGGGSDRGECFDRHRHPVNGALVDVAGATAADTQTLAHGQCARACVCARAYVC